MEMNISKKRIRLYLLICVVGNFLLKVILLVKDVVPFNADEAVVALMARHILQGERPIFFYGQTYMGSLDAWFVALGFLVFGQKVWIIRLVQTLLYLAVMLTTFFISLKVTKSKLAAIIATLLLSIPVVNTTLYTTASLGGYGEGLLIGNILLLLGFALLGCFPKQSRKCGIYAFSWGVMAGLGLWVFGITLVYSIPIGIAIFLYIIRKGNKRQRIDYGIKLLLGIVIGAFPWWLYAFENGLSSLIAELGGGAIAGVEQTSYVIRILNHLIGILLFGSTVVFGLRPPWAIKWLAIPLMPIVLAIWFGVLIFICRRIRNKSIEIYEWVLLGIPLTLFLGLILSPFGADPSGRYFLPVSIPLAIFGGWFIVSLVKRFGNTFYILILFLLGFNIWGTIQCVNENPPGITTQFDAITQVDHRYMGELIEFLNSHNEKMGYTNYWVSYPLAFLSQEQLIFIPRLPYHQDFRYTERDDRYEPYTQIVSQATRVAYITTNNDPLDDYLREQFQSKGISWKEHLIGDYHIYYYLSMPIKPQEIGLGTTTKP